MNREISGSNEGNMDKSNSLDAGLLAVFQSLFSSQKQSSLNAASSIDDISVVKNAKKSVEALDANAFYFHLAYKINEAIEGVIMSAGVVNDDAVFIFMHPSYIEGHFEKLLHRYEGRACCADKSGAILRRLLLFYTTGQKIEFDLTGEYTYHIPKVIFREHDEIIGFFQSIVRLYYGDPGDYLRALAIICRKGEEHLANTPPQ